MRLNHSKVGQLLHRRHIWGPSRPSDWSLDAFPFPSPSPSPAVRVFPAGQDPNSDNPLGLREQRRIAGARHSREQLVTGQDIHSDQAAGIVQLSQGRPVVCCGRDLGRAPDHKTSGMNGILACHEYPVLIRMCSPSSPLPRPQIMVLLEAHRNEEVGKGRRSEWKGLPACLEYPEFRSVSHFIVSSRSELIIACKSQHIAKY